MSIPLTPPIKWHGGKHYLASRIIGLMPPRCINPNAPATSDAGWLHYVEPYAGGLAVLLALDPEGISEVVNDRHLELTNFWKTLQDKRAFQEFKDTVEAIPFSFAEFAEAQLRNDKPRVYPNAEEAAAFFVACRQSLAGRMDAFAPLSKTRTRRGMNEQASAWIGAVDGLPAVHERLRRVVVLSHDAIKVIKSQDGPRTLYYLDPPYLHETRATTGEYAHEMSEADHAKLLDVLQGIQGRFLLSGYRSGTYDRAAAENGWRRVDIDIPNNAAGGATKRRMTECVWCNFDPPTHPKRLGL